MFDRNKIKREIVELKEQFANEVSAIRSYTKVMQSFAAGLKEGQKICSICPSGPPEKPD